MTDSVPERPSLDVGRLQALLGSRWASVQVVDEIASTNATLLSAAAEGSPDRALLAAENQVSGRGRFERVWTSPPRAGLTFSMLVQPGAPVATWGWLPLLAGVALVDSVRAESQGRLEPVLKWPNDLLASPSGGKLAGVLSQTAGPAVVIGIGLNVSTTRAELPVDTATSVALSGAPDCDRTALLAAVAAAFDEWFTRWNGAGGDAKSCGLAAAYRSACATVGLDVRVSMGDGSTVTGTATDVDDHGALLLDTGVGPRSVVAGDVEHVRVV